MAETILEKGETDIAGGGEDDHARKPDLEGVEVEAVGGGGPAKEQVVHERKRGARGDTVCQGRQTEPRSAQKRDDSQYENM